MKNKYGYDVIKNIQLAKEKLSEKSLAEEKLADEFKRSNFKSHQAFLAQRTTGRDNPESKFWEWMESTPTKYNEDGTVYHKRKKSSKFEDWMMSETTGSFRIWCFIVLAVPIWYTVIMIIFGG